ncbi:MAG: hypothetical protein U0871_00695 [Gemmataceae bacterium]
MLFTGREEYGWPVGWYSYYYQVRLTPALHERSQVEWNPAVVVAAALTAITLPLVVAGWRTRPRLWRWAAVGLLASIGGWVGASIGGAVTGRSAFECGPDGQQFPPDHPNLVVGRVAQRWWADAGFDRTWQTYTVVSTLCLGSGAAAGLLVVNPFRRPRPTPPLQPHL